MPSRLADEKQIERQWLILQLIGRRWGVTKQELVQKLQVSERTIERDLHVLTPLFPIVEDKEGRQKRVRFMDHYEFPALDLSPVERLALSLAEDVATFLEGTPYFADLKSAIEKVQLTLPRESQEYFSRLRQVVSFKLQPVKDFQRVLPWIELANHASIEHLRMELVYRAASTGETTTRKVDPYGVFNAEGTLRLAAYCHLRQDYRDFCFDTRMLSLKLLEEHFEPRPDFDLDQYAASGFEGMRGRPVRAVIRVEPPASRWVRERNWDGLERLIRLDNEVIEMHFDTGGREGLMRWVLQWGGCAEVISPPDFREEVVREVEAMQRGYAQGEGKQKVSRK